MAYASPCERRRRAANPNPISAAPSSASEAGSGTGTPTMFLIKDWPRLISCGEVAATPGVVEAGRLIVAASVIENGLGSLINPLLLKENESLRAGHRRAIGVNQREVLGVDDVLADRVRGREVAVESKFSHSLISSSVQGGGPAEKYLPYGP